MADAEIHAGEQEYNFRQLESLLASTSSHTLRAHDLVSDAVVAQLASIGEFAEVAHGSVDPRWVFENRAQLTRPGFPLEGYDTLANADEDMRCVTVFHSSVGQHQGYVAVLPRRRTVLLAFSGTSNSTVALRLLRYWKTRYHLAKDVPKDARVHRGFQQIYLGMKDAARAALVDAFTQLPVPEDNSAPATLILTGHSLGGVLSYFSLIDILHDVLHPVPSSPCELPWQKNPPIITLAVFGAPRPGNNAFSDHYASIVSSYRKAHPSLSLTDWSVIGHRDGVPSLPPYSTPLCAEPFYLYHGDLYAIPASERTFTRFPVERDESRPRRFEKGGHNYYNVRDMEGCLRRMRGIREDVESGCGVEEWTKRYIQRNEREEKDRQRRTLRA
ncbi:alpha/beta-hydrolase [Exidia glandulosa HHB12029]|uniref:Alpha/beta-hydrolase n=1 Tax=Exidia glandulosa HHB12029 TaxID=1314781 RepID=A0A166ATF8_EXIGL|nr:alpha/beta-hydrolase [Exidia glandulosa HHB12029]